MLLCKTRVVFDYYYFKQKKCKNETNARTNYEWDYTVKNLAGSKIETLTRCLMKPYAETILK